MVKELTERLEKAEAFIAVQDQRIRDLEAHIRTFQARLTEREKEVGFFSSSVLVWGFRVAMGASWFHLRVLWDPPDRTRGPQSHRPTYRSQTDP